MPQNYKDNNPDFARVQKEMLEYFARDGFELVEVTAGNLVTLEMDARFQVRSVTIQDIKLPVEEINRLQEAVLKAFNDATGEVTRLNADRLRQAISE
jgi:DNA-binding protein YbaB